MDDRNPSKIQMFTVICVLNDEWKPFRHGMVLKSNDSNVELHLHLHVIYSNAFKYGHRIKTDLKSECDKWPKLVNTFTLTLSMAVQDDNIHSTIKRDQSDEARDKRFQSMNKCMHLKVIHAFEWGDGRIKWSFRLLQCLQFGFLGHLVIRACIFEMMYVITFTCRLDLCHVVLF